MKDEEILKKFPGVTIISEDLVFLSKEEASSTTISDAELIMIKAAKKSPHVKELWKQLNTVKKVLFYETDKYLERKNLTDFQKDVAEKSRIVYFKEVRKLLHKIALRAADEEDLEATLECMVAVVTMAGWLSSLVQPNLFDLAKRKQHGSDGGKNSGAKLQAKAREWTVEALNEAREYVALNPQYTQEALAIHLKDWINPPATIGHLKNVISDWQKSGDLTKKQVKHASPAR
jgi:hypothetical protein